MKLLYDDSGGWPWQPDLCPFDQDLVQWTTGQPHFSEWSLLHIGTGLHHYVGINAWRCNVLGWTASPEELRAYVDLVIEQPRIARRYQVLFGDAHIWPDVLRFAPRFSVVSVPHLCEFTADRRGYQGKGDESLLLQMLTLTNRLGQLVTYNGSCAYDRALPLLRKFERKEMIHHEETYRSLDIWRRA